MELTNVDRFSLLGTKISQSINQPASQSDSKHSQDEMGVQDDDCGWSIFFMFEGCSRDAREIKNARSSRALRMELNMSREAEWDTLTLHCIRHTFKVRDMLVDVSQLQYSVHLRKSGANSHGAVWQNINPQNVGFAEVQTGRIWDISSSRDPSNAPSPTPSGLQPPNLPISQGAPPNFDTKRHHDAPVRTR